MKGKWKEKDIPQHKYMLKIYANTLSHVENSLGVCSENQKVEKASFKYLASCEMAVIIHRSTFSLSKV